MPITRLNHAVLYVRDVEASRDFYADALGFTTLTFVPGRMAFLRAGGSTNDHDLGLFQVGSAAAPSAAGMGSVGLYHLAWEVDTLAELKRIGAHLASVGSLVGASDHSTTKALYAKDPDGIEFEVCWLVPASEVTADLVKASKRSVQPLDIDAEIARHGADTRGGIGVSIPVGVAGV
jgi:catechol-2,3-dioxygenase